MQVLLIIVVLWFLMGQGGGASSQPRLPPFKAPPPPNPGDQAISVASVITGVPLHAVGAAASAAPTWVKAAVFPVGVTAGTYEFVRHPIDTSKAVVSKVVNVVEHPLDSAKSAYHALNPFD